VIAILAYILFTALNIYGVKAAAMFELVITLLAVGELILFTGITLPHFEIKNIQHNAFPHGWQGILAAIPFAIWFFLGIEGVANTAEEVLHPQRTLLLGFGSAILTLVILCVFIFLSSIGVNGWEAIVYRPDGSTSDSPLPLALARITGNNHLMYHLLITIGLFGLIASFHGLILAAGRSTYEFGKVKYAPAILGDIHPKFKTPSNALIANMMIGIIALLSGKTSEIITISVFGALTLYILSMISMLLLRKKEPDLDRPFRVPFYPVFPVTALVISIVSIVAMTVFNFTLALFYILLLLISYTFFKLIKKKGAQ
jgi:ethanolamine permease